MRRRVEFRVGGRDSRVQYGGSFKTLREATVRRNWIAGELAAKRVPDLTHVETKAPKLPMFPEAFDVWRASRVDVDEQTRNMHRSSVGRIFKVAPHLRGRRVDELTVDDVAVLIAGLARLATSARRSARRAPCCRRRSTSTNSSRTSPATSA
jgi:hypothetical protein